jgi:tRNA 2-thiouridine synthesizing protein E
MNHAATQFLDAEGFVRDPNLWDPDLAGQIAARLGLDALQPSHWAVIDYLREHYLADGTLPWEGNLCRDLDLVEHCVHRLFGGPLAAWKIAGLPDPGEEARTYMENLEPPGHV